jgi:predicted acetyltransferase
VNITVRTVTFDDKPTLRNLMYLYLYDMSEFDNEDVARNGLFEYKYLDHYWTDADRHAFFIDVDGNLAGFVLVNRQTIVVENANTIAEFFVMRKYRRHGIGESVVREIFGRFPGEWEVREIAENSAAQSFWRNVIHKYTDGQYLECCLNDERWNGPVQTFRSPRNEC